MAKFDIDIARSLEENGKLYEISSVTTYQGIREKKDGSKPEIEVKIYDSGPGAGETRYFIEARELENPVISATGNPAAEIDTALSTLHWFDLD